MADIILNVEVRDQSGTGAARAVRRTGKIPGILYGGGKAPVNIAVKSNEFRKALYTGKLLGHLVTLKYGDETQPVIAKDVQFHPVNDEPLHFDLYRVDEHQQIKIDVAVHFTNHDASPGIKQGASLEVVRHTVELSCPADHIPEDIIVDLTGREMGDTIRMSDIKLPKDVTPTMTERDFVIATLKVSASAMSEAAEAAAESSEG